MSTSPYEQTGRTKQKSRTRQALVDAARALLAQGVTPTVEAAAAAASVSRPTAYRYFPSRGALLAATNPEVARRSLLPDPAPSDPRERLDLVSEALVGLLLENEAALRAMLRFSLEPQAGPLESRPLRTGRRIGWIADALAPLEGTLGPQRFRKLVLAIAASLGIEPLVWLIDIAGLERNEAAQLLRESARALLHAAS